MSTSKRAFKGGYLFREFDGQPSSRVVPAAPPKRVVIPLKQGPGSALQPMVKQGDAVRAGELIARNDEELSNPIHASISGTVAEIRRSRRGRDAEAVVVERGGAVDGEVERIPNHTPEWRSLSPEKIEELIYLSGAASLAVDGIPTRFKSSPISTAEVEHIVIRAVADDVIKQASEVELSEERTDDFASGCRMLRTVFPESGFHIAVSDNRPELYRRLIEAFASEEDIQVHGVSSRYPQGRESLLVPTVLGTEFPLGFKAINIGVVVMDVAAVLHVYEAVAHGMPVISRTVILAGSAVKDPLHVSIPVGASIFELIDGNTTEANYRVVLDSIMTGTTIEDIDSPVTRTMSGIYVIPDAHSTELFAFARPGFRKDSYTPLFLAKLLPAKKEVNTNIRGERRACLSCSFCEEVCPVRIQPNILHRYVEREMISETLRRFRIFKCIDCNLCTYVCPSKIPVAELLKKGKELLVNEGISDEEKIRQNFALKGLPE